MPVNSSSLQTYTLENIPAGKDILRIMAAGLNAVDPYQVVHRFLHRKKNDLLIGRQTVDLSQIKRVFIIGFGKASIPMSYAIEEVLDDLTVEGVVITKKGSPKLDYALSSKIFLIEAGHPLPDKASVLGAQQVINILSKASSEDLIICNISGGGSSLLTLPKPGIKLDEIQILTKQLLACGATIDEINTIRKHIDMVKGGGLLDKASSSRWVTLILSDVIGDPVDRIASGPTAPDPSTYEEAYEIIRRYKLQNKIPSSITSHLTQGVQKQSPETLKPGNPIFNRVHNLIVGNNSLAVASSLREAEQAGYVSILLTTSLQGEASQVGLFFGAIAQQIALTSQPVPRSACILAGGETTVTLHGKGIGGRNQEVALGSVIPMAGLDNIIFITLASDGGDGPTDAAGAVVSGNTLERAKSLGMDPRDYLHRNDSYHFFEPLGDLIKTGPTLTNVGDLNFLFAF